MIQTWLADVTPLLNREIYRKYYNELPMKRKEKADKLQQIADKALSVGTWILYERAKLNNPEVVAYNLSHSGKYGLCSIAINEQTEVKVGCDIEKIGATQGALAKRFFTGSESEYVTGAEKFYRMWVLKESFAKATGEGLKVGMANFEVSFDDSDKPKINLKPERFGQKYFLKEYSMQGADYKIAVCATSDEFAKTLEVVRL